MTESNRSAPDIYRRYVLDALPRMLGAMDREPLSSTAGSFDRDHWSWKFRDAPVMSLQMAMAPLASLWSDDWAGNPWRHNTRLSEWLELAIRETVRRQGRHGGFETIGPNTWDHGVTLAMCYSLSSVLEALGEAMSPAVRQLAVDACARGCAFALRTSEDYAFINNHQALFALAYYRVGKLLGDRSLEEAGDARIAEIRDRQSPEGWYPEYGGPDAGYETLGLHYLSGCWLERRDDALLDSMSRSVAFLAHCVHPDGSLGGVYGSRHCSLYYPGGLERLASRNPDAAGITRFMLPRLAQGNAITPASCDIENLPTLLMSYLDAARAVEERPGVPDAAPLPAESLDGVRHFPKSGITVAGTSRYYAITNASKGCVFRIFDRQAARLAAEDAGVIVEAGGRRWSSQFLGGSHPDVRDDDGTTGCVARLARVRQVRLTPLSFLVLRLLNLTVFRSLTLGAIVRRRIIGRLITNREGTDALTLDRQLRFLPDRVEVHDVVRSTTPGGVTALWRSRSFTAIHMGSANYFSSSDAGEVLLAPVGSLVERLARTGMAEQRFAIVFPPDSPARLEVDATDPPPQATS